MIWVEGYLLVGREEHWLSCRMSDPSFCISRYSLWREDIGKSKVKYSQLLPIGGQLGWTGICSQGVSVQPHFSYSVTQPWALLHCNSHSSFFLFAFRARNNLEHKPKQWIDKISSVLWRDCSYILLLRLCIKCWALIKLCIFQLHAKACYSPPVSMSVAAWQPITECL